jgi:hypothetical protein
MASQSRGVLYPRPSGSYECVHCGYVADEAAQEAMLTKIQQERQANAQGAKEDPEP